jgi:hypothetical protein
VILLPAALVQLVVLVVGANLQLLQTGMVVETTAVLAVVGGHRVVEAMAPELLAVAVAVQLLRVVGRI